MTPLDFFLYIVATLGGIGREIRGFSRQMRDSEGVMGIAPITSADHRRRSRELRKRLDAEFTAVGEER